MSPRDGKSGLWVGTGAAAVVAAGREGVGVGVDPATVVAAGVEGAGVGLPWSGLPGVVVWLGVVMGAVVGGAGLQMPANSKSLG